VSGAYDRRGFLGRGLKGAGVLAGLGLSGTALEACGPSTSTPATTPTTNANGTSSRPLAGPIDTSKPRRGGSMTLGTWSEVNGLSPPQARWDATGYLYGNALFDTLVQTGADGLSYPYLARSVTPNADYTSFTIVLRPDIKFHSGAPCDASAVANSLEANVHGYITGQSLRPIASIKTKGADTVVVNLDEPWAAFPSYLSGQVGYICSPKMLASTNQGATTPDGTGPFSLVEWVPNSHLTATRNPNYWQPGYPYLDEITFKPIIDNQAREDALRAGTIQAFHCQYPQTIKDFFGDASYQVILGKLPPRAEPDVDFVMLNVAKPPLDDIEVRQALAMAIDKTDLLDTYGAHITVPVSGPFQPGSIWYTPTDYPAYDPAGAKRLVDKYTAKNGHPPSLTLTTIVGPAYSIVLDVVQANWQKVGVNCQTNQVEFANFLDLVVLGQYQAATFEQFGATDPDQNYVWWSTDTYAPPGKVSLNIARNRDPLIQSALDTGRTSTDIHTRIHAYQQVARRLAADLPYLWLGKTFWAAIAKEGVSGINNQTLPGGRPCIGFANGSFLVHQLGFTS
jgi:peptide/nickel transport system substrate-binding protein